jgi:hypothetical protein
MSCHAGLATFSVVEALGSGCYKGVWLDPSNGWIYRHLLRADDGADEGRGRGDARRGREGNPGFTTPIGGRRTAMRASNGLTGPHPGSRSRKSLLWKPGTPFSPTSIRAFHLTVRRGDS